MLPYSPLNVKPRLYHTSNVIMYITMQKRSSVALNSSSKFLSSIPSFLLLGRIRVNDILDQASLGTSEVLSKGVDAIFSDEG